MLSQNVTRMYFTSHTRCIKTNPVVSPHFALIPSRPWENSMVLCPSCLWVLSLSLLALSVPRWRSPKSSFCCGQPMPKRRWRVLPPYPWEAAPMLHWDVQREWSQFKQVWICWKSWQCSREGRRGSWSRRWSWARWATTERADGCSV